MKHFRLSVVNYREEKKYVGPPRCDAFSNQKNSTPFWIIRGLYSARGMNEWWFRGDVIFCVLSGSFVFRKTYRSQRTIGGLWEIVDSVH